MAKMKAVQPQMTALRERYPDDKAKQQQELMALYKKEKINPLAGCLPIVIQIPVFFSLYKVLFVTIEMRHAPFFGWIHDLSAPDPTNIFNLFGLIPFDPTIVPVVGHFLHLGAWPLIMGVTMWAQMKLNPAPPDPTQADDLQLDADDLHLHAGELPGRPGDLLGLEQLAVGAAAERHHAQARRQDRVVRQHQGAVREEEAASLMFVLNVSAATLFRRFRWATAPMDEFTRDEIETGRRLFTGEWHFVAAAGSAVSLPPMRGTEIALAGRSNVGKSSLINALTGRKNLARTSRTPGRTQELIFFTGGGRLNVVDMPGYGYAAAAKTKIAAWTETDPRLFARARQPRPHLCAGGRPPRPQGYRRARCSTRSARSRSAIRSC